MQANVKTEPEAFDVPALSMRETGYQPPRSEGVPMTTITQPPPPLASPFVTPNQNIPPTGVPPHTQKPTQNHNEPSAVHSYALHSNQHIKESFTEQLSTSPPSGKAQHSQSLCSSFSHSNIPTHQAPFRTQLARVTTHSYPNNQNVPIEVSLTDQGTRLKLQRNYQGALQKYSQAAEANGDYAPAYYNAGVVHSELSHYEEAVNGYQSALKRNPYYVEAYCNIGVIYKALGRLTSAAHYYEKALAVNPNFSVARNNMAIVLTDLGTLAKNKGDIRSCIELYKKALVFNALYADAYYNLGVVYMEQRKIEKAIISYELSIHFSPICCEAYNNLGVIFKDCDNLDRATDCYKSALQINRLFPQTLNNLGVVFTMQGKLDEAYNYIKKALYAYPQYAEAYNNLGVLFRDEGKIAEAIFCYDQSLRYCPSSRNAAQNRLLAYNYCSSNNKRVFMEHEKWGKEVESSLQRLQYVVSKTPKKLRIGYISPDFFNHSISYFIEGILANHNSKKYTIFCYSNVTNGDSITRKLKSLVAEWRDIYNIPAIDVAQKIVTDKIDILIELTGHTAGNRLDVLALKPAPIQVTYLGYPNTTGLQAIDYLISDSYVDPETSKQEFTEKVAKLPNCYLTYKHPISLPNIAKPPCMKNHFITFGSFSNLAKLTPEVLTVWSTILHRVPNSHIALKCKPFVSQDVRKRLYQVFMHYRIETARVELLPLLPTHYEHLYSYGRIDIALDPWPYSGMTTTCESLLMGVPVITMRGSCRAHNLSTSILSNTELFDYIAHTKDEYINKAVIHAENVDRLMKQRATLRDRFLSSHVCDNALFTKNLESCYDSWWQKCQEQ